MPVAQLKKNRMMAHLLDALDRGEDIGHYGRLVFVMVARHFMSTDELHYALTRDPEFCPDAAYALIDQVNARDYSPPRRERILEWQAKQTFPICPEPDDPDDANVYRDLEFPERVYRHIAEYREEKAHHAHDADAA